jgi:hypothetical protein
MDGAGTSYHSGESEFSPVFSEVHVAQSLVVCLFHLLTFVFLIALSVLLKQLIWIIVRDMEP